LAGGDPSETGSGAAGGAAFGLRTLWSARLVPGAVALGELVRLADHIADADLVVTGEGRLDPQSLQGKVVGHVVHTANAADTPVWACVGQVRGTVPSGIASWWALEELAGSAAAAIAHSRRWLREAGRAMAESVRAS
jgi:glycerate kinase